MDDLVFFKLPELVDEHALGDSRHEGFELAESFGPFFSQMPQDEHLPFTADDGEGQFFFTLECFIF